MRPSLKRWLVPIPAALVLQGVYGLQFASGVFVSAVHDAALTKAVGLTTLAASFGLTLCGIQLHRSAGGAVTMMSKTVAVLGALGIAAQSLMGLALQWEIRWLLYVAAVLTGFGSGAVYVVSILVLQAWVPEFPGIITGTGLLVGGGGSLFGICAFQEAIRAFGGPLPAMNVVGVLSGAVSLTAALAIEHPPTGWQPLTETPEHANDVGNTMLYGSPVSPYLSESVDDSAPFTVVNVGDNETQPLLPHKGHCVAEGTELSIHDVIVDPSFFFLSVSVFAAVGPGFGLVLAFPRVVNTVFAIEMSVANQTLFWVTLVGVIGRLVIGLAIDLLQSPADTSAAGFHGAKNINSGLLALQSMALAVMPLWIRYGYSNLFALSFAVVYVTFSGGAVVSACLARTLFSPENSTLAFALLGVAMGFGRYLFSLIVAFCQSEADNSVDAFGTQRYYEYDTFVHVAFVASAVGLVSSYFVSPSKIAYQNGANSPVFADVRS